MLEFIAKGMAKQGIIQLRLAVFWFLMSKPKGVPQSEIADTFDLEMENSNRQALIAGLLFLLLNQGLVHMETTRQGARVYIAAPYLWGRIALIVVGVLFAIFLGVEIYLNTRPADPKAPSNPETAITQPLDRSTKPRRDNATTPPAVENPTAVPVSPLPVKKTTKGIARPRITAKSSSTVPHASPPATTNDLPPNFTVPAH